MTQPPAPDPIPTTAPDPAPASVDDLPIVVVTRFSFLGQSGWKSEASRDGALLFEPARLEQRLQLFESVNLGSLVAQDMQGFHHYILTSDQLPAEARARLEAICLAAYGEPGRFTIDARPPGRARKYLRQFLTRFATGPALVQVVLDDDDGLAASYMSTLRQTLRDMQGDNPALLDDLPKYVSFPTGYALSLRGEGTDAALFLHHYPYINLGLAQIDTAGGKNILAIHHQDAPKRFGCRLVGGQPMFLRAVHDFNDSRVAPHRKWQPIPDWQQDEEVRARFPALFDPGAPWAAG